MVALLLSSYDSTLTSQGASTHGFGCGKGKCPAAQRGKVQGSDGRRAAIRIGDVSCERDLHARSSNILASARKQPGKTGTRRDAQTSHSCPADKSCAGVSSRVSGNCQGLADCSPGSPGDLQGLLPQPELRRQVGVRWPKSKCIISVQRRH